MRRKRVLVVVAPGLPLLGIVAGYAVFGVPAGKVGERFGEMFIPLLVTILIGYATWVWRQLRSQAEVHSPAQRADKLAAMVRREWEKAGGERKLLTDAIPIRWTLAPPELRGRIDAAVGLPGQPRRFAALPNLDEVSEQVLSAGGGLAELFRVFGGLASGRIVLTGSPGAGKSAAGVLLLLEVLKHRATLPSDKRTSVPVPVYLTLADWDRIDPRVTFEEWLTQKIADIYFTGRGGKEQAAELIDDHVAAIVDGLDEVRVDLRPMALEAMSASRVRLVLLTRTEEMALAAQQHWLVGAATLTLSDVDTETAADYLNRSLHSRPPAHWDEFLKELRSKPSGDLAASLSTPLLLTLIRDTYRGSDDIGDLMNAAKDSGPRAVENHLLDRLVEVAYTPRAGKSPPYSVEDAQRTLSSIASRMTGDDTQDLVWWRLSHWVPRSSRILLGLVIVSLTGLATWLAFGLAFGLRDGLVFALLFGLISGPSVGAALSETEIVPRRIGRLEWRTMISPSNVVVGLVVGLSFGLALGPASGLATGLVVGILNGLALTLVRAVRPAIDPTSLVSPEAAWRSDQRVGILVYPTVGLLMGWMGAVVFAAFSGFEAGATVAFAVGGLLSGLALGMVPCRALVAQLTFLPLALSYSLPVRLMHFLEDAHEREVLRTVGPVYQFRHARLQERLAHQRSVGPLTTFRLQSDRLEA